ncbi:M16 family metallopeptidase [Novosphingobium umbonatum]|uniref:M16 family metallopeptidase n=1 Tax=Novosphingobium umbonatum TaxID=1908524 RepID=UPI001FEC768F|nr:M16 family metallopeptidase [Novosphingobium umbonatum]
MPPLPKQDAPWLYKGSDVPHDREWYFGTLPNGLRWAVRYNQVPPGQVSIRVRIDAGAMHEKPEEAGFAHLIEHLVFRQSKYLGESQAIPTWQRLGASFGSDTNAETTATATTFKIDLPNASDASLDESMKLLSGMVIAPTLSESDIRTEAPIVLAEKRERGGTSERLMLAMRKLMAEGQPLADHATIGSEATINGAHEASVRAFHQRWYRPENAVVVIAGDADPRLMAALITRWFGDWRGQGAITAAPDFGAPKAPPANDPLAPVGNAQVMVEPSLPRSLLYGVLRPWHEKQDTVAYNQGLMLDQVAQMIVNRRLESRARSGATYLSAHVDQQSEARSVEGTFVTITPLDGRWDAALTEVRAIIADMLQAPPSEEEIARELAEINVIFESQVQQRALQAGGKLADDLVQAVDIHETVAAPAVVHDIFRKSLPMFTPQAVHDHAKALFEGKVLRGLYITPQDKEATSDALRKALAAKVVPDPRARASAKAISFAQLPPIGKPVEPVEVKPTGLLAIEEVAFANGVKAQLWPTKDDPGRVTVKVRFGAGWRAIEAGQNAYAALAGMALVSSGEGPLGQEELESISNGRKMGFEFRIEDGVFQFSADTRDEDLADQLYLFAAKFAMPRWDAAPVLRAKAAASTQFEAFNSSPGGVLERDLRFLQRGNDPRFAMATPDQMAKATPEGFRQMWEPILAQGPIEVQIYGDFNRAKGIDALKATFGALAPRAPIAPQVLSRSIANAAPTLQPVSRYHRGDANQAAAVISWPTSGGLAGVSESRQLDVLSQIFANRMLEALREKAGAAYAPQVAADWPIDVPDGGTITAMAQMQPDMVPQFFATADAIAADLAAKPVGADELALVIEPLRQQIARASTATGFFMGLVEGGTQDSARYKLPRGLLEDYTKVTPEQLQALARHWLQADRAFRLQVLPEAKGKTAKAD